MADGNGEGIGGIGRRMPITMTAFTIGALGMIGVPPLAGYISKFYLQKGAVLAGEDWAVLVLGGVSVLTWWYCNTTAAGADGAAMNQIAAMHVNHRICMLAHLSCGTIRPVYQICKCAHLRPFHWWMLLNACPAR